MWAKTNVASMVGLTSGNALGGMMTLSSTDIAAFSELTLEVMDGYEQGHRLVVNIHNIPSRQGRVSNGSWTRPRCKEIDGVMHGPNILGTLTHLSKITL